MRDRAQVTEITRARPPVRTLVMLADDDEVILEHAIAMYRSLRDAELAVIPGTSHGLLVEKPSLCNSIITDFLANDPTPTLVPIRRTPPPHPSKPLDLSLDGSGSGSRA